MRIFCSKGEKERNRKSVLKFKVQLLSIEVQKQLKSSEVGEWERGFELWTKAVRRSLEFRKRANVP